MRRFKGGVAVRKATLFDILLLIKLIIKGCFHVSVMEDFTPDYGHLSHLKRILLLYIQQSIPVIWNDRVVMVISKGEFDVGLIHFERKQNRFGRKNYQILMAATLQGTGNFLCAVAVIESMIDILTEDSTLKAFCTGHSVEWESHLNSLAFSKESTLSTGVHAFFFKCLAARRPASHIPKNLQRGVEVFLNAPV